MGLANLRAMPRQALSNENFYVDNLYRIREGGPVQTDERGTSGWFSNRVMRLGVRPTLIGRDYYFPYLPVAAKAVKVQNPHDGDIALTAVMDGCALEVTYLNGDYIFYHDANGVNMHRVANAGTRVCRIEDEAYWDDTEMERLGAGSPPRTPVVQFVCVYKGGFWHVGCSGLLLVRYDVVGTFVPRGGKYRGYFNDTIRLVQYR